MKRGEKIVLTSAMNGDKIYRAEDGHIVDPLEFLLCALDKEDPRLSKDYKPTNPFWTGNVKGKQNEE